MSQKLKTSADFKRVLKELADPTAKPHRWVITPFGYCTHCRNVTEYYEDRLFASPAIWSDVLYCRGCGCSYVRTRQRGVFRGSGEIAVYYTDPAHSNVPAKAKLSIEKHMSRDSQFQYFVEELKREKEKLSHEIEQAQRHLDRLQREAAQLDQFNTEEA